MQQRSWNNLSKSNAFIYAPTLTLVKAVKRLKKKKSEVDLSIEDIKIFLTTHYYVKKHSGSSGDSHKIFYCDLSRAKNFFDRNAENALWHRTFFSTTPSSLAKT